MRSLETGVRSQETSVRSRETSDSVSRQTRVVERDTLREVTTITVQTNERGDTVKVVQVTDLTRARNRDTTTDRQEKTVVRTDTVYIERRDSTAVSVTSVTKAANQREGFWTKLRSTLKWALALVVALTVFYIVKK
jgi:hypothetical protein